MLDCAASSTSGAYEWTKDIILPSAGILLTLFTLRVAIRALQDNLKIARANFDLQLSVSHRDTWNKILERHLYNIRSSEADPAEITKEEEHNINFVIINTHIKFDLQRRGVLLGGSTEDDFLYKKDVGNFFSYPLPAYVWQNKKYLYDNYFNGYIIECINISKGIILRKKNYFRIIFPKLAGAAFSLYSKWNWSFEDYKPV